MIKRRRKRDPREGVKPSPCTNCGKVMDSATETEDDAQPNPGDYTICLYCHHLMVFADDMTMRDLTDEEVVEAAGEPMLIRAMRGLAAYEEWKKRKGRKRREGVPGPAGVDGVVSPSRRSADSEQLP